MTSAIPVQYGIWTHDLCDTGAVRDFNPWPLRYWDPCSGIAEVMGSNLVRVSTVYNCEDRYIRFFHRSAHVWFSCIYSHYSLFGRFIWIQHNDQLLVGLLAQLVELCIKITNVFITFWASSKIFWISSIDQLLCLTTWRKNTLAVLDATTTFLIRLA